MKNYKKEMIRILVTGIILMVVGIGAAIPGFILLTNDSELSLVIGFVLLAVGVVFLIVGCSVLTSGTAMVKRSFCSKCKTFIDYENDVEWAEEDETFGSNNAKVRVSFVTHCSNCGHEKHFTKNITSARVIKDNSGNEKIQVVNVENQIRKLFLK